ncbi:MAG: hypothetical protein IKQ39_04405, partial [Oscillospiraceae bacterium]|nr:hypothetical protein [Oscillospiraceae bacterium]
STTAESTTTNSTTTESTTTNSTTTESTTTNSTTTESTTTNSTTTESTTTGTTTGTTKVVTTYEIVFEPPTRVNYWSHDDRTFKTSGGLKDMVAKIVVSKYYTDENGNVAKLPFEEKELEVTAYTNPDESEDSPMEIWNNEISAALGKTDWTYEEAQGVKHANKYRLDAYYTYSADINDPDFDINNGEPLKLGDFPIYIGVKGDYNLDNYVDAKDAQLTLKYYVDKLALKTPSLNADPELDGEDGLVFFLIDVCYRDGKTADSPLANPKSVDARDAQTILKYYVDALALKQKTWTDEVGYDYLDYFYGDVIQ